MNARRPGIPCADAEQAVRRTTAWLQKSREALAAHGPGRCRDSSSASCRATSTRICACAARRKSQRWTCPAMPSAGSPWGRSFPLFRELLHFSAALLPPEQAEVPHGHRHPRLHPGGGGGGDRPVRLRVPDADCAQRQVLTRDGTLSLRNEKFRRTSAHRRGMPVLHLPAAQPRVPAPSVQGKGDRGGRSGHPPQPQLPPALRARDPRGDRRGRASALQGAVSSAATMRAGSRSAEAEERTVVMNRRFHAAVVHAAVLCAAALPLRLCRHRV